MGQVYVLTNISMPRLVKVGRAACAEERVKQLSQATAVPTPFDLAYSQTVEDDVEVERFAHAMLAEVRVNERREFFVSTSQRAMEVVQLSALMSAWNRAAGPVREEFLLRIDRPVFDRGRAA